MAEDDLKQKLVELIYELLPEDEARELTEQISSDPEVARAYTEARIEADMIGKAARLKEPRLALKRPATAKTTLAPRNSTSKKSVSRLVAIAAALLVFVAVGGYLYHWLGRRDVASKYLHLLVTSPAHLSAGIDNRITISTQTVHGAPLPAKLELALYDGQQRQLLENESRILAASNDGVTHFDVPGDLDLPDHVRLEVLAYHDGGHHRMTTPLRVAPDRAMTQLALDKPWYKPGEKARFRSLTLSSSTMAAWVDAPIEFEILDPGGAPVANSLIQGVTQRGVGNGEFFLPPGLRGGPYTLVARSLDGVFAEEKKQFLVRRYRLPRLKKELEFTRDSYGPGDTIVADLSVERAEGGAAAGATLRVTATVDDQTVFERSDELAESGFYQVQFELPEQIARGAGQLAIAVDDGGTLETIAKTIPINLGKVEVEFYPEGGDLVAGLENRVYFVARDTKGDPVDAEGDVIDASGEVVTQFRTDHEGRGQFALTPASETQYRLQFQRPAGVEREAKLPQVSGDAQVVLSTGRGVIESGEHLQVRLQASERGIPLAITAHCRGVQVGQATFTTGGPKDRIEPGSDQLTIPLSGAAEGVIRVTVYDFGGEKPRPVAERLAYRRSRRALKVNVSDHSERYSPGDSVELSFLVSDEKDRPASSAVLGVAVVDDALLSLARETDKHKPIAMPTHFWLASEIQNPGQLEDANFYLADGEEAANALDLLLGTQGWRRFLDRALKHVPADASDGDEQREAIEPLMVSRGKDAPPLVYDNLLVVQEAYDKDFGDQDAASMALLNRLGSISFIGGLALIVGIALMALLRVASSVRTWLPALTAAIACITVGWFWMVGEESQTNSTKAVAQSAFKAGQPMIIVHDYSDVAGGTDGMVMLEDEELVEELVENLAFTVEAQELVPADANELDLAAAQVEFADEKAERLGEDLAVIDGDNDGIGLHGELAQDFEADFDGPWPVGNAQAIHNIDRLRQRLAQATVQGNDDLRKQLSALLDERLEQYRFPIRQYAHQHAKGGPGVRSDFAETLYWNPLVIADEDGRATIRFDLSDAITTFDVHVDAHSSALSGRGRIGTGGGELVSRIPFNVEPKLPLEVTAGDIVKLPLAVVNDTGKAMDVRLELESGQLFTLSGEARRSLALAAGERRREHFTLAVTGESGDEQLTFRAVAGDLGDAVRRSVRVVPPGFPVSQSYAGRLEGEVNVTIELPEDWVPGSLNVSLAVYPTTLADLERGVDGILQEPYGCFEQASTANYPNVLALQYMQEHHVANPAVTRRAKELLDKGYVKLAGYECKKKGYEWFGSDPGHEALSAYGLMEFRDMAEVYDVDGEMITRTADWLLARRDGKGGFERNPAAIDSFGAASGDVTNAYITWALSESGQKGIDKEVDQVVQLGQTSDDPYIVALTAASALNDGRTDAAVELLTKLKDQQKEDGHLVSEGGSITRSGGHSLKVETTALAALAWLKHARFTTEANQAIDWLVASRQGGGSFGSTQATILALKALVEHARANRGTVTGGELIVLRDEAEIGRSSFASGTQQAITIEGLSAKVKPGTNELTLQLSGDNSMPYSIQVAYRTRKPVSDDRCPVKLSTALAREQVTAGETVALEAALINTTDEGQPMTMAILGIPAGLKPRVDQLEELKQEGTIEYFETTAREVVCYWRSLAPEQEIKFRLDLVAEIPGQYTAPASRAYLYYTPEQKRWLEPVRVKISAK